MMKINYRVNINLKKVCYEVLLCEISLDFHFRLLTITTFEFIFEKSLSDS